MYVVSWLTHEAKEGSLDEAIRCVLFVLFIPLMWVFDLGADILGIETEDGDFDDEEEG